MLLVSLYVECGMNVNRRQILSGSAFTILTSAMASSASACSIERVTPLSLRFWQNLWQANFIWPGQVHATIKALIEGILFNSPSAIERLFDPQAHLLYPSQFIYDPGPTLIERGKPMIDRLAYMTSFTQDQAYDLNITPLHSGKYFILASLNGSGNKNRSAYGFCGEDPSAFRSQPFCAMVDIRYGRSARIIRIMMLY